MTICAAETGDRPLGALTDRCERRLALTGRHAPRTLGGGWRDLRTLRTLLLVRETGSLRGAGRELGCSSQAVAQRMAALERELGVPVYERSGRGVQLTPAGEALARRAGAIERQLGRAAAELSALRRERRPRAITLGAYSSQLTSPARLAAVFERHVAQPRLKIWTLEPEHSLRLVESSELDAALIDEAPGTHRLRLPPRTTSAPVIEHKLWVALPRAHRLAKAPRVPLSALARDPWLLREEGSLLRTLTLQACRSAGFDPDVGYAGPEAAQLELYRQGRGAMLMIPSSTAALPEVTMRPLVEDVRVNVSLVWRAETDAADAIRRIGRIARLIHLAHADKIPEYKAWLEGR